MRATALTDVSKLLSGNLLAKILGVASLMLFARILSKEQLAVFPAYLMLIGLANLFLSFGIYQYFLRTLPLLFRRDFSEARSLIATGSLIILAGTIPVVALAIAFRDKISGFVFDDPHKGWIVVYASIGSLAYAVSKIVEFLMWARGQFTQTSIIQVAESVVRPVLTIGLFFAIGYSGIVLGLTLAQFIIAMLSLYSQRDLFAGGMPRLYPLGRLFKQSTPYYLESYLWYVRGDGDTLLVSAFLGPVYLSTYFVAKTLLTNLLVPWAAVDKVALERLARDGADDARFDERVRRLHHRLAQTAIPGVLFLIAFTPYLVVVMGGVKYANSAIPAMLLLLVGLVQFQVIALDRALFLAGSPMVRLTKTAVESFASLAAAFALAPLLGIVGVAAARVVGPIAGAAYGLFILARHFSIRLPLWNVAVPTFTALIPTALIIAVSPRATGFGTAIGYGALGGVAWLTIFAFFTYLLNKAQFDLWVTWLARRFPQTKPLLRLRSLP